MNSAAVNFPPLQLITGLKVPNFLGEFVVLAAISGISSFVAESVMDFQTPKGILSEAKLVGETFPLIFSGALL